MHFLVTCEIRTAAQWRLPKKKAFRPQEKSGFATFQKKSVSPAGKIGIWHCAAVLISQVLKKCTNLDLSLLYILILEYIANSLGKIIF